MTTATIVICMIFRDMMTFPVVLLLAFYFFHAPQPFIYCLLNVLSLLPVLVVFALLCRILAFVASPWVVLRAKFMNQLHHARCTAIKVPK